MLKIIAVETKKSIPSSAVKPDFLSIYIREKTPEEKLINMSDDFVL